ncbi:hypothetical protein KXX53_003182 [Aspergillus fumigatus]|nr:hypothetical protein KXX53_003182 [Aspergillus fumigatus]
MSAQNSGRQSPPPETQSQSELRGDPQHSQRESNETKEWKLESNPKHPLEDIEAAKYSKVHLMCE